MPIRPEVARRIRKIGYVMPVGQYYNTQPIVQPRKPSGADFQSQNQRPRPQLKTDAVSNEQDQIHCPICGMPTLATLNAEEMMAEDIRCTNCAARFRLEDLLARNIMSQMFNVMTANPNTQGFMPPQYKAWTQKDIDLTVKDYVGFDTSKGYEQSDNYVKSDKYRKLMREYLKGISPDKRNRIVVIIKNGIIRNESIKQIAQKINGILDDEQRSETIARTEVVRISSEGNLGRMEAKGTETVEFISAPEDGRLCEECKSNDGKIFTTKEAHGMIPIHPHCRCLFTEHYEP